MVSYSRYLDSSNYRQILTSLLEVFPHLQEGLSSDDALVGRQAIQLL